MLGKVLVPFLFSGVNAYSSFQAKIPNGDKVKNCEGAAHAGVGHIRAEGSGPRNQFGLDWKDAGLQWTTELCQKDSDGDGISNGRELGDPNCTWIEGGQPQFDRGITHPGIDCSSLSCETGEPVARTSARSTGPVGCAKYEHSTTGSVTFTFSDHTVGADTSYMLQAFQYPADLPQAAVTKFEFVIDEGQVTHHMILYRCQTDQSDRYAAPGPKRKMECQEVLMAWAVGGSDFCVPENLAFLVDSGEFFILEIHYDNPNGLTGLVDNSGMRLHTVPYEGSGLTAASVAFVGARLPTVSVPPRKEAHRGTVHIPASRFNIPENVEVKIFGYMQHMHQIGVKQWLTATGVEASEAEVACNTNYDFDLQEAVIRPEPFILRRGMGLTVDCVWDSRNRDQTTNGGDESDDEMCIVAIMFYPAARANLLVGGIQYSDKADKICGCPEQNAPIFDNGSPEMRSPALLALLAAAMSFGAF